MIARRSVILLIQFRKVIIIINSNINQYSGQIDLSLIQYIQLQFPAHLSFILNQKPKRLVLLAAKGKTPIRLQVISIDIRMRSNPNSDSSKKQRGDPQPGQHHNFGAIQGYFGGNNTNYDGQQQYHGGHENQQQIPQGNLPPSAYNPTLGNPGAFLAAQQNMSQGGSQVFMGQGMMPQHRSLYNNQGDALPQLGGMQMQSSLAGIGVEDEAKHYTGQAHDEMREGNDAALQSFLEKVFQSGLDTQKKTLVNFDDCRHKLEVMFEDKYQPDRDFLDYLNIKKERNYEDFFKGSDHMKQSNSKEDLKKRSLPPGDDQDLMPMDLDEDHNLPPGMGSQFGRPSDGSMRNKHEEEKSNMGPNDQMTYFDRCAQVGRVGPIETKLDKKSAHGEIIFSGRDDLDVEAMSSFSSIRATAGVFKGRFYYEVMLKSAGLMQIGWCTLQTSFTSHNGVGDDESSYAYDGHRVKKWNKENLGYGEAWSVGDVIGTLIDFDRKQISFWRNNKNLGKAFSNIKIGANRVYFPAISLKRGQRAVFNFGRSQMRVTQNQLYGLIDEPYGEVNGYKPVATQIIDYLKSYLVTYYEYQNVAIDKRLAVGSMLIEYLFPLILDDYIMEDQLLQFLYEVIMIKKPEFKTLIFDLFSMHLSTEQLKVFIAKLMRYLSKRILNTEIIVNNNNKPSKKDYDMTYFQLLIDLIERDEFLYAWLISDYFFLDLETIFEMHMPSQTDWDTFYSSTYYHEYLPGRKDQQTKYLKSHNKAQSAIEFTQAYWFKLTSILMDRRKRCITSHDIARAPFDRFRDFLHHIACRSTKNPNDSLILGGNNRPHQAGLNNNYFLSNIFTCFCSQIQQNLLSKPVQMFPFHCFFMRDGYDFDEGLKQMDRIGGSFTHLETELGDHLKPFKGQRLTDEEKETFLYAKDLLLIAINGILPEMEQYTMSLDQMYMNHRKYLDLTKQGRIEKSSEIFNEMSKILRTKLQGWRLSLQNKNTRDKLMKFSIWLLQLVNYIDSESPDLIYILPDYLIQIPFELLRMMKRESQLIVPTGVPICPKITGPGSENQNSQFNDMGYNQFDRNQIQSSLADDQMWSMNQGNMEMVRNQQDKDQEERFFRELVTFISKHHIDDRIANPDLKEMYLVRLNVLLQHNHFILLFQEEAYAQENFILMMMKSFIKNINLRHVTKNILRLAKGQGFKEIIYEENVEKTSSPYFLYKLRMQLLNLDHKVTKDFMNAFFNSINDITSELFIIFKELKNNFQVYTLRKTLSYFQASIDLLRMCELFATWCPELFLDVDHIHSSRLMNFIMFVMNSVFVGEVSKQITFFSEKVYSHSATLEQFLAPIIGILVNLYMGIKQQEQESEQSKKMNPNARQKYETLTQLFESINAFNEKGLGIFMQLKDTVWPKFEEQSTSSEHQFIGRYDQMLQELDHLIRIKEAKNQREMEKYQQKLDSSGKYIDNLMKKDDKPPLIMGGQVINEEEFADEDLCQICCQTKQNTEFIPCMHRTCKKCIQTHLLNNEKCPFCNMEIKSLQDI